jgi:hypothetical protein
VNGNIFNSKGVHVGVVMDDAVFGLKGSKALRSQGFEHLQVEWRPGWVICRMRAARPSVWTKLQTGCFQPPDLPICKALTGGFRARFRSAKLALLGLCFERSTKMDHSFIKEQAERCRRLAENADQFTKKRLLNLAARYDGMIGGPSRASLALKIPGSLLEARLQKSRAEDA